MPNTTLAADAAKPRRSTPALAHESRGVKKQFRPLTISLPMLAFVFMAFIGACGHRQWAEYTPSDGSFVALFPVTPTKATKTVNTAIGPMDITIYAASELSLAYSVAVVDYPADHVQQVGAAGLLDSARDGAVANTQGTLLSEEILNIRGNPGRELKVSAAGGKGTARCKLVLVGNRLFQVIVAGPSDKSYAPEVRRFLDSFSFS